MSNTFYFSNWNFPRLYPGIAFFNLFFPSGSAANCSPLEVSLLRWRRGLPAAKSNHKLHSHKYTAYQIYSHSLQRLCFLYLLVKIKLKSPLSQVLYTAYQTYSAFTPASLHFGVCFDGKFCCSVRGCTTCAEEKDISGTQTQRDNSSTQTQSEYIHENKCLTSSSV